MDLASWIFVGGILHFGILLASASVPRVLDWRSSLDKLDPLFRQIVWIHGAFIVIVIVGFGLLSLLFSADLSDGSPLARGVCLFIGLFWAARLALQLFVVDAKDHLNSTLLKIGYHALSVVFLYHATVYGTAAFWP